MLSYLRVVMQSRIQSVSVFYVLAALYVLARESDYFCVGRKNLHCAGRGTFLYRTVNRLDIKVLVLGIVCTLSHKDLTAQGTFCSSCALPFVLHIIFRISGGFCS